MTLTKKNNPIKKKKKYSKNIIKRFRLYKKKNIKNSLKVDQRKKTFINPKAKYKNRIFLEKFKQEKKRLEILKKNQPNRIYEFNLNFFYNNNKSDTVYLRILSDLQKICEEIKNYNCNKTDLKFYYSKFNKQIITYATDAVPDEFALPRKISNESEVSVIYKSCIDKQVKSKLRIVSFNILNLLIRKTRFNVLKKNIIDNYKNKISEELFELVNNIINKYIQDTIKDLGNKHLKYLFLIVY